MDDPWAILGGMGHISPPPTHSKARTAPKIALEGPESTAYPDISHCVPERAYGDPDGIDLPLRREYRWEISVRDDDG